MDTNNNRKVSLSYYATVFNTFSFSKKISICNIICYSFCNYLLEKLSEFAENIKIPFNEPFRKICNNFFKLTNFWKVVFKVQTTLQPWGVRSVAEISISHFFLCVFLKSPSRSGIFTRNTFNSTCGNQLVEQTYCRRQN